MVSQDNLLEIRNLCIQNPDKEVCGIVTNADEVIQIANVSKNPKCCFVFSKREYFKFVNRLSKEGKSIKCIWHTHPGTLGTSDPSQADLDFVKYSKRNSLIVSHKDYRWINAQN